MGYRVERLLEVHKAHIEWLLVLACLVHQYSEIRDLISCPPSLSESRLFVCNFRFSLHSDTVWSEGGSCLRGRQEQLFCNLHTISDRLSWEVGWTWRTSIPLATHQFPRSPHIFCAFCPVPSLLLLWTVLRSGPHGDLYVALRLAVWRMARATSERSGGGSCSQYSYFMAMALFYSLKPIQSALRILANHIKRVMQNIFQSKKKLHSQPDVQNTQTKSYQAQHIHHWNQKEMYFKNIR